MGTMPRLATAAAILLVLCSAVLAVLALESAPYTGLRLTDCGEWACIRAVDPGSPASSLIREGDRLVSAGGFELTRTDTYADPDYVSSLEERHRFWEGVGLLNKRVRIGGPLELVVERAGAQQSMKVTPTGMPALELVKRLATIHLVALSFLLLGVLVARRRPDETGMALLIGSTGLATGLFALSAYTTRDLTLAYPVFRTLSVINQTASPFGTFGFLHFALLFPRPRSWLPRVHWLIPCVYVANLSVPLLALVVPWTRLVEYLPLAVHMLVFVGLLLDSALRERNPILARQAQWAVLGLILGTTGYMLLTAVPASIGLPFVSEELTLAPSIVVPIAFVIAVYRHRLMDLDGLVDGAVVWGVTLAVLGSLEFLLVRYALPAIGAETLSPATMATLGVLVIVFAYLPVRNGVISTVERLLRRGPYRIETELDTLSRALVVAGGGSAWTVFDEQVRRLLHPSGTCIFTRDSGWTITASSNDSARHIGEELLTDFDALEVSLATKPRCRHALAAYEEGLLPLEPRSLIEPGVLVPIALGSRLLGFALLLAKADGTPYTSKDLALLDALSLTIAHVVESNRLRGVEQRLGRELSAQRDLVLQELHDGLGSVLIGVALTAHVAEQRLAESPEEGLALVRQVRELAQGGASDLRQSLALISTPDAPLGAALSPLLERAGDLLANAGAQLRVEVPDEVLDLQLDIRTRLGLTRAIQECITNTVKHARAGNVSVNLDLTEWVLTTRVRDDGVGFDPAQTQEDAFGLVGLRKRMLSLGGETTIDSAVGAGTTVILAFPVNASAAAT